MWSITVVPSSSISIPISIPRSLRMSPTAELAATSTFPLPLSTKSVMAWTSTFPPNSSTDGAKMMRFSYWNSPYLERLRPESSASLNTRWCPLWRRSSKKVECDTFMESFSNKTSVLCFADADTTNATSTSSTAANAIFVPCVLEQYAREYKVIRRFVSSASDHMRPKLLPKTSPDVFRRQGIKGAAPAWLAPSWRVRTSVSDIGKGDSRPSLSARIRRPVHNLTVVIRAEGTRPIVLGGDGRRLLPFAQLARRALGPTLPTKRTKFA